MNEVFITPTVGRIVLYCLSEADAVAINRRRTTGSSIADRIHSDRWPLGAQAHIGNTANEGDVCPAIVVRVWVDNRINVQVFLDGNDAYWGTSISPSMEAEPGKYHWMPYQLKQATAASTLI